MVLKFLKSFQTTDTMAVIVRLNSNNHKTYTFWFRTNKKSEIKRLTGKDLVFSVDQRRCKVSQSYDVYRSGTPCY